MGNQEGLSGWAYNVRGNGGVQLKLRDGKGIMIGSQRATELAEAITSSSNYRPIGGSEAG